MTRALERASAFFVFVLLAIGPAAAGSARFADWTTVTSDRFGFEIASPANVFTTVGGRVSENGQVLISRDRKATLMIGAFANDENITLAEYRAQILEQNYTNAELDFAPIRSNYFVVSGTLGNRHFYERVSFTCGGRLINSWALLYTVDSRDVYDRVIEAMARTYAPGPGKTTGCQ